MAVNRGPGLLVVLLLGGLALAADAETGTDLQSANALYQQGDYQGARAAYEALLQEEGPRVNILYNLGNACYLADDIGWAIVYYERALLVAPRDRDLRQNLATALAARRATGGDRVPGWGQVAVRAIVSRFTLNELAAAAAVAYLSAAVLALLWLTRGHLRRRQRWAFYGLLVTAAALAGLAIARARTYHDPARVVVVNDTALLNGPAESFPTVRRVYEGEYGVVAQRQGIWREVQLETGARGWMVQSSIVSPVPEAP
ncbi:MAG: hypothetical protein HPY69_17285 [Armatimonadetes bacterium]|nr:hypothetical protein [Armatimonadota bacterium]